jgi:PAS domain S-box-containing protein
MTVENSQAQQLQKKVKLFEAIVNKTQDGIIVFNHLCQVVYSNVIAGQLLGAAPEELRGKHLSHFIPQASQRKHEKLVAMFTESEDLRQSLDNWNETKCCRMNGEEFPAKITIEKYQMSGQTAFIVSLRDMSEVNLATEETKVAELGQFREQQQKKCSAKTLQVSMEKSITQIAKVAQAVKDSCGNRYIEEQMSHILQNSFTAMSVSQKAAFYTDTGHTIDQYNLVDQSLHGALDRIKQIIEEQIRGKDVALAWDIPASAKKFKLQDCQRVEQIFYNIVEHATRNLKRGQIVIQLDQLLVDENKNVITMNFECKNPQFGISQQIMDRVLNASSSKSVPEVKELPNGGRCLRLAKLMAEENRGNLRVVSHPINGTHIYLQLTESLVEKQAAEVTEIEAAN